MRGLRQVLEEAKVPVRVNATAPSWTQGGMVPEKILAQLGEPLQSAAVVARGAALLMADGARQGHGKPASGAAPSTPKLFWRCF